MKNLIDNLDLVEKNIEKSRSMEIKSHFGMLNSHNGLRRSKMHTLMSTSGAGKSTLVRSILNDIIVNNALDGLNVKLWLSEESVIEFQTEFFKGCDLKNDNLNAFGLVDVESEIDLGYANISELSLFEFMNTDCDVLIFDNLTTSILYNDKRPSEQAAFLQKIKSLTNENNIATILVVHADGKQNENNKKLLSINDVRGSKTITNLSEFFYVFQPVYCGSDRYTFIQIKKHRGQDIVNMFYGFKYDKDKSMYTQDFQLGFEDVKRIFKNANEI